MDPYADAIPHIPLHDSTTDRLWFYCPMCRDYTSAINPWTSSGIAICDDHAAMWQPDVSGALIRWDDWREKVEQYKAEKKANPTCHACGQRIGNRG